MVALHVRRLREPDWSLYRRLRRAAVAEVPAAFASSPLHERERGERSWCALLASSYTVGAFLDEDAVGFASGRLLATDPHTATVGDLWVAGTARDVALPDPSGPCPADVLLLVLCGWARVNARSQAHLVVAPGVPRMETLAARHGFTPTGERRPIPGPVPRLGMLHACDLADLDTPDTPADARPTRTLRAVGRM